MISIPPGMIPAPITAATQSPAPSTVEKPMSSARAPGRLWQDADGDLGNDAQHALGADHDAEQIVALRIEMLAAEPDDLAVDHHHFDAEDIVGRKPVFEAVHAAGILGDIAADRAGDLARRVGRIVEAGPCTALVMPRLVTPGCATTQRLSTSISRMLVELAHAEQNAVGERQRAARERGPGAARHDFDPSFAAQ